MIIVAPYSDPQWANNILENYSRQGLPCELWVIENGAGVGTWQGPGHVLRSKRGKPFAIGEAVRNLPPGELVTLWDQDDWYGPMSCRTKAHYMIDNPGIDMASTGRVWVQLVSGRVVKFEQSEVRPDQVWGGSVTWWQSDRIAVADGPSCKRDTQVWIQDCVDLGATLDFGIFPDVYCRQAQSVYQTVTDEVFLGSCPEKGVDYGHQSLDHFEDWAPIGSYTRPTPEEQIRATLEHWENKL